MSRPAARPLPIPSTAQLELELPCRIGLVSDTHGWLDPKLLEHFTGLDAILHAGDIGDPAILTALAALAPTVAVRGNIDGGRLLDLPLAALVDLGRPRRLRIALLHIAGNPARPSRDARALLERARPNLLVVGHSHIAVAGRVGALTWINPGAAGHHGIHDERSAFLLEVDAEGGLQLGRIDLGPRGRGQRRSGLRRAEGPEGSSPE
ncbi:MAG: metallophosphoesterase family protein [Chloroflexi bacterium]|nr:metallophosphoesterase family protein [Chloroflexota bacterium]